jgi:hypothetical protein
MNYKLITLALVLALATTSAFGQYKQYYSKKNSITIANGNYTQVTNDKSIYIMIDVREITSPNNMGTIVVQDIPFISKDYSNRNYFETFRIYKIKLNEDGVYDYWTIDIAQDGQTVLFEVDLNSSPSKVVMSRYSPTGDSKVLKRINYLLD